LHTHAPLKHSCPPTQACPPPHVHAPDAEQPSPVAPQFVHPEPALPHVPAEAVWQTAPMQQPFGHDDALHTQLPLTHAWPAPHAGPDPHSHAPPAQLSALALSQALHEAPLVPQVESDAVVHVAPEQQPFGQDAASHVHTPPEHA
jgi:hypothetical protein